MDQRQWKNLLQLLGLGSAAYGLYAVWADYRIIYETNAAMNSFAQGLGVSETQNMVSGLADAFGYGLSDMLLRSPWVWAGLILFLAPYVIGVSGHSFTGSHSAPTSQSASPLDLFVNCAQCNEGVRESAPFCPHCGATRS